MKRHGQRGVALITVMLVFFIASTVAVAMLQRQQMDIRTTSGLLDYQQAHLYALGGEEYARQILYQDMLADAESARFVDHPGESWAEPLAPFEVEHGALQVSILDLQGRLNINSVVTAGQVNAVALQRLRNLLDALGLRPTLADAIVDWLDSDQEPFSLDGAEDLEYLDKPIPYRTADAPMGCPSELRLIHGLELEEYQQLRPFVVALAPGYPVNINTASALVLRSIFPALSESAAVELVENRPEEGFDSVEEFLTHPLLAGMEVSSQGLTVSSSHFQVETTAQFAGRSVFLTSYIYRDVERTYLLGREYGQVGGTPAPAAPE